MFNNILLPLCSLTKTIVILKQLLRSFVTGRVPLLFLLSWISLCTVNSMVMFVDKERSFRWLKIHLHSEMMSTVRAIQDQVIVTRVIEAKVMHKFVPSLMCRVCGQAEETIAHLLTACPVLALTAYLYSYNLVAVIHWHLLKVYSLLLASKSWFTHHPLSVVKSSSAWWDFSLETDYKHAANHPDLILFDYQQRKIYFGEVSCPADVNVQVK